VIFDMNRQDVNNIANRKGAKAQRREGAKAQRRKGAKNTINDCGWNIHDRWRWMQSVSAFYTISDFLGVFAPLRLDIIFLAFLAVQKGF
jgi:hypothetical protein